MLVEMSTQAGVSLLHHLTAVHKGIDITCQIQTDSYSNGE